MRYAIDTNVLPRAMEQKHPMHRVANDAVLKLLVQGITFVMFPQVVREFWNAATRPAGVNGIGLSSGEADVQVSLLLVQYPVLEDGLATFHEWLTLVRTQNVSSKQVHDAYIAAMRVHGVTHLLTFNTGDSKRFGITAVDPATV